MKATSQQYGRSSPLYCRYCMQDEFQQYLKGGKGIGGDDMLYESVATICPSQIPFDFLDDIDHEHKLYHHHHSLGKHYMYISVSCIYGVVVIVYCISVGVVIVFYIFVCSMYGVV